MPRSLTDIFHDNPVDFMTNNIVITPECGGALENGGVKYFTLTKMASVGKSIERPGVDIKCYQAHPTNDMSGNGMFLTYWCPYKEGELKTTTVGNGANLMFTAPMNGCSFGIGSAGPDGNRLVGHSNAKGQPDSWTLQNKVLRVTKMNDGMVNPNTYMNIAGDDPVLVTTFGVRDASTNEWSFYYQLNTMATGNTLGKTLIGVYPIL